MNPPRHLGADEFRLHAGVHLESSAVQPLGIATSRQQCRRPSLGKELGQLAPDCFAYPMMFSRREAMQHQFLNVQVDGGLDRGCCVSSFAGCY
jgi:hypothetical protein